MGLPLYQYRAPAGVVAKMPSLPVYGFPPPLAKWTMPFMLPVLPDFWGAARVPLPLPA